MKAITRRKFMGIVVGGLVGTIFIPKSLVGKVKIKQEIIDEEDIRLIKASEIVSDGLKASNIKVETISRMEYNVVDDLVEEEKVSNILFNTVKRGKTTFAELAHWHHFVYERLGNIEWGYIERQYVDGNLMHDIMIDDKYYETKDLNFITAGDRTLGEFWFRRKV